MNKDNVIEIKGLAKRFRVYDRPLDRLKEWLTPSGMSFHWAYWALREIDLEVNHNLFHGILRQPANMISCVLTTATALTRKAREQIAQIHRSSILITLRDWSHPMVIRARVRDTAT